MCSFSSALGGGQREMTESKELLALVLGTQKGCSTARIGAQTPSRTTPQERAEIEDMRQSGRASS
jgi:hypothetical protein